MRISEFVPRFKALTTRIRFDLKRQLFLYGHGFRPQVSDENHQWKRNFSKTLTWVELFENAVFACTCGQRKTELLENAKTHYQFQKKAEGRFTFLSFILGLIFNLNSCFQTNLALLIIQADYCRRLQNIIRFLSPPVSRGGRLDLPLVWLCFCPEFDILNCSCDFEERHNKNINPHQRNSKMVPIYYFVGS